MSSLELFYLFYTNERNVNSVRRGPVSFRMLCIVPSQVWELEKMPMPQGCYSVRWLGYTTATEDKAGRVNDRYPGWT